MIRYLQRMKHKKGFTLVEMIVVLAIISVLSAMLIPQMTGYVELARVTAVNASAATIRKVIQGYMLDMAIQGVGMKRSGRAGNQQLTITAQTIWLVSDYKWMVKTECKPGYMTGTTWTDKAADNTGGNTAKTCYYDHENWYKDNHFHRVSDTATVYDQDHVVALSAAVRQCMPDFRQGFVMAFFEAGLCKGVAFIPDWNHLWPQSTYDGVDDIKAGFTGRGAIRPRLLRGRTDTQTGYVLPEMKPWHGVWPRDVDDRIWLDGTAGIDAEEGWYVGTSPAVLVTAGRRAYTRDWEDPIPGTNIGG